MKNNLIIVNIGGKDGGCMCALELYEMSNPKYEVMVGFIKCIWGKKHCINTLVHRT